MAIDNMLQPVLLRHLKVGRWFFNYWKIEWHRHGYPFAHAVLVVRRAKQQP